MTTEDHTTIDIPRYVRVIRALWLAGTAVSVLSAAVAVVVEPGVVTGALLAATLIQGGIAISPHH